MYHASIRETYKLLFIENNTRSCVCVFEKKVNKRNTNIIYLLIKFERQKDKMGSQMRQSNIQNSSSMIILRPFRELYRGYNHFLRRKKSNKK